MLPVIAFPVIDPVAISIGTLDLRWYALAYMAGLIVGWRYAHWIARQAPSLVRPEAVDDFVTWATLGVVVGGRLGDVLFYRPDYYFAHPAEILAVWHGGMAFHGGALGVLLALLLFAWRRRVDPRALGDLVSAAAPIGLFLGRIANFIKPELPGRPSDVAWAMVFPGYGPEPRHPSQLYEAGLEGLLLFVILFVMVRQPRLRLRPGLVSGVFMIGYALSRMAMEFFREPDIGFPLFGLTMGQLLSLPLLLGGLVLVLLAPKPSPPAAG
jgi:phosphatidylglycerol:prolipoprotein diacylglycerol transferase